MPSLPSIFTRTDFFGKLLPGYLTTFLYLLLFTPDVIFHPAPGLTFDLLSTIVFLIAGPAAGLALQQFHRGLALPVVIWLTQRRAKKQDTLRTKVVPPPFSSKPIPGYAAAYARVRLDAKDSDKAELDSAEADYDFSLSAGVGLWVLALAWAVLRGWGTSWIPVFLLVGGAVFVLNAYWQWRYSVWPIVSALISR